MKRHWVTSTVVLVGGVAAAYIASLRMSSIPDLAIGHSPRAALRAQTPEKVIDYRLDGPSGGTATVSYLDEHGVAQTVDPILPWAVQVRAHDLTVAIGVLAQSASGDLACRILIDGAIRAQSQSHDDYPAVNCQVAVP